MARVVIEKLSKTFKSPKGDEIRAVCDLDLTVEDGEFLVLVGPSGCGKSTTLRLVAGLEEITVGTISLDGAVINKTPARERDIAMVFQNHALYPHMTVYENLAFGLKLRHLTKTEIGQRVGDAAKILGLQDCLDRRPAELSGGQRQRVAVGRAIVRRPKLFLFDEPLSNLDAQLRGQLRREISRLHKQLRATMLYVTHDQVEAMTMGDRIAVMKEGVLQQVAKPMTLYREPANLFVAGFIGSPAMNFFPGTLRNERGAMVFQSDDVAGKAKGFSLQLAKANTVVYLPQENKKVVMGIRPEHIAYADSPTASQLAKVEVLVETVETLGAESYLHAEVGGCPLVARVPAGQGATGATMLHFNMSEAHFFDSVSGLTMRNNLNK